MTMRCKAEGHQAIFQSSPWRGPDPAPFLRIDTSRGAPVISGTAQGFVGHRMLLPGTEGSLGLFAEWDWDGSTLRANVDRHGFFSLFVFARGREIAISPSILQLLAHGADPEPDPVALAVFHRIGFFLDGDTPFRAIKVLPPNGQLLWRDGVLDIKGGPPQLRPQEIDRDKAVEALIELPRSAIRRFLGQWEGPIVLPLSGGRDSRHVLLEMVHQDRRPDYCLTFHHGGSSLNTEVQAARAVAARAGVRHVILGKPRRRARDSIRALLLTQLCADEHAQMMPMHDYLQGSGAAAIDGIGGDILTNPDDSAADFLSRARRGDYEGIARALSHGHGRVISRPDHSGGAGALFSPGLEDAAIHAIAQALRVFDAAPDPYQAFWFWNRTRREISFVSTAIMGGAKMVFCPYLDPDFVELGLSLPWSVTCDQRLHDDAIARAFPAFANVPYASDLHGASSSARALDRLGNMLDGIRVVAIARRESMAKSLRRALEPSSLQRGPADIYRLHQDFVGGMDTSEASRLLALQARLDREAAKGEAVVSDVHPAA